MSLPTDTSLSLTAGSLTDLYPETASGREALGQLDELVLLGNSATALPYPTSSPPTSPLPSTTTPTSAPSMPWSLKSASSPPMPPPIVIKWCCAPGSGG